MQKYIYYIGLIFAIVVKGLVIGLLLASVVIGELLNLPLFLFLIISSAIIQILVIAWFNEHPDEVQKLIDLGLLEEG